MIGETQLVCVEGVLMRRVLLMDMLSGYDPTPAVNECPIHSLHNPGEHPASNPDGGHKMSNPANPQPV